MAPILPPQAKEQIMTNARKAGSCIVALALFAACDQTPTQTPELPAFLVTGPGTAVPSVEEVDLCKVATSGSYSFTVADLTGPDARVLDAADGSVTTAAGECERIAFQGGAPNTIQVTENVAPGSVLDSIVVEQLANGVVTTTKLTGTNTATAVLSGEPFFEGAVITFYNTPARLQGCTPGYWKNHPGAWAGTGFSTGDDFDTTFGVNVFNPNLTLLQAAFLEDGGIKALARHAVAALLNAADPNVNYPLTTAEVITAVQNAVAAGGGAIEALKNQLDTFNRLGCPL
jgi:hypothetical protein